MVNTVWIVRKPADFPAADLINENDIIILIQDGILRQPSTYKWYACKEDVIARGIKIPKDKLIDYSDIIDIIEKANKVVIW